MRELLTPLYELQQIDLGLARIAKAKAALDDGTAKSVQVQVLRKRFQQADGLLHEATVEMKDSELNLKTVESKQKNYQEKLYGGKVSNPKELDSMEKEIEMLGRQKDKLEERILELMDIIEERTAASAKAHALLDKYEADLVTIQEKFKSDSHALAVKAKQLADSRGPAVALVDPVMLKRYDSMRVRQAGVVLSKVNDDSCSACHTVLNSGMIRSLKADTEMQTCENCSRILYLEK